MTFASTILSGVLIFVLGQFLLEVVIKPMIKLKKSLGALSYALLLHHSKIVNATPNQAAANEIKICSIDVLSKANVVMDFNIMLKIFGLPSKSAILLAAKHLNRIYYCLREESRHFEDSLNFNGKKTDFVMEASDAIDKVSELLVLKIDHE